MTSLRIEADRVIKKLKGLPKAIDTKVRKEAYEQGAELFVQAARSKIRYSQKPHFRYSNSGKLTGKIRAPKGRGKIIATYKPGNLRRSIRILKHGPFKRSSSVWIGPKTSKRTKGVFGSKSRVDGYYAHMVEFGTVHSAARPFMRPAFIATRGKAKIVIIGNLSKRIRAWKIKNGFA